MNRQDTNKLSDLWSGWFAKAESLPSETAANVEELPEQSSRRSRHRKPKKPRKFFFERYWIWATLGLLVGIGTSGYYTVQRSLDAIRRDLPDAGDVLTYARDGTLTIQDADGRILQTIGPATREKVAFSNMPPMLVDAFIAAEDKNFYGHDGIDYRAVARAIRTNFRAGEVVEGASTITQQLARIVFLDQDRTYERKLREALLAQKIETELDKDQILERYLNLVYLGSGAYGVADAAWIYFSKTVSELTLAEMAMVAGVAPAPTTYSPLVNPDLALQRRDLVLDRMLDSGFITPAQHSEALNEELALNPSLPKYINSEIPYFTTYVQQQLPELVEPDQLELGGLVVETTLDPEWQQIAEETVSNAIEEYGYYEAFEQAALVSIDPNTGEIKAMVGGNDFEDSQFNRVTQAQRQPGSTFKTFVYATAIATGMSPNQTYVDAPYKVDGYEPQNYGRSHSGTVTVRAALISSINVVAVKTLVDIGFDPVVETAHKMGIESELIPTYSMALGASEVNLLELTGAYGTLATQGIYVKPHGITRILNRYGEEIYNAADEIQEQRAIDEQTAAIMTWMLRGVVESGTGSNAILPGRPVAGKTGTSENRRDLWFIGYIPQLVTGVWLGNDDNAPTWGASSTAALTWYDFMHRVVGDLPVEDFPALPPLEGREPTIQAQPLSGASTTTAANPNEQGSQDSQEPAPAPAPTEAASGVQDAADYATDEVVTPAPSPAASPVEESPPVEEAVAPEAAPVEVPVEAPAIEEIPPPPPPAPPVPVEPGPSPVPLQEE
jgi:penicillin-binding protein 1A